MSLEGKTLLLAWELGEGLGHLPPLKAIAGALKPLGVRTVFALRETQNAVEPLRSVASELCVAPHWAKPAVPEFKSRSFADILAANGYSRGDHAAIMMRAWDKLIDFVKPDAIVCDHAPSAMLSACGRIPIFFAGNGLAVPPADEPFFPPYIPGTGNIEAQRVVFDAICEGFMRRKRPAPSVLTEPFRGDFRGVYSFPLIDCYRSVRKERVLGPIETQPAMLPIPEKNRLFVYSTLDLARIDALMQCILDIGPEASVYLRGSLGAREAVLRSRGVEIFDTPPPFSEIMPRASVVFSHAGSGFTNAALSSGRPHIVFPRHFEAKASATGLANAGCGITLQTLEVSAFRAAYDRAKSDIVMKEAAQRVGQEAQDFSASARALEVSVEAARKMLS